MGWAVLLVWGRTENNLKPGVVAGELVILRMWSEAVRSEFSEEADFIERLEAAYSMHTVSLIDYFNEILPQLQSRRAVLMYRQEHIFYAQLILEELGRLGVLLLFFQKIPAREEIRSQIKISLIQLINEHRGCILPVYDGQSIELTIIFAALMGESDWNAARTLLGEVMKRLLVALQSNQHLPVDTDLLEDAIALNILGAAGPRDFFQTSSMIPALATVAAFLGDKESLAFLRDKIQPLVEGVTLERWFAHASLECLSGSSLSITDVGASRVLAHIGATPEEERVASVKTFTGVSEPTEFRWYGKRWVVLVALSARIYRHPIPTWFFLEYAGEIVEGR